MKVKIVSSVALGIGLLTSIGCNNLKSEEKLKPNVIFVLADQWRAQSTGYCGNIDVKTPAIDKLAKESIVFTNAVSCCPVCTPARASLLTGQYTLTHGLFYNDKPLDKNANTIAKIYKSAGYETGYIGKWHVNGHEPGENTWDARSKIIPNDRRQGFEFWQGLECTHDYNNSWYWGNDDKKARWEGYDAFAQTKSAVHFINQKARDDKPFILFLSWGPPHDPYSTAPEQYRKMYSKSSLELRPNVPESKADKAKEDLAGYYAHITALDDCMNEILVAINNAGIKDNTILVFTSDHGDMLYSHGFINKQQPWDESIKVPMLIRFPKAFGNKGKSIDLLIGTPDIMPTLLGLSNLNVPESVEGTDYSEVIKGKEKDITEAVLIECVVPFHQWNYKKGGREYRGIRTKRYTYCRDLNGPWLLFDNQNDPYQLTNLVGRVEYRDVQVRLEKILEKKLIVRKDEFLPGDQYMKKWEYTWDNDDSLRNVVMPGI